MRHEVVCIDWGDAFIDTHDFSSKEVATTEPVWRRTVGFLVGENKHGYVLATDEYFKAEDGVAGKMFIPYGMVKRVRRLTGTVDAFKPED